MIFNAGKRVVKQIRKIEADRLLDPVEHAMAESGSAANVPNASTMLYSAMDAQNESVQQAIRRIDKAGYYLTLPKAILCFLRGDIEHKNMRLDRTPANREGD